MGRIASIGEYDATQELKALQYCMDSMLCSVHDSLN